MTGTLQSCPFSGQETTSLEVERGISRERAGFYNPESSLYRSRAHWQKTKGAAVFGMLAHKVYDLVERPRVLEEWLADTHTGVAEGGGLPSIGFLVEKISAFEMSLASESFGQFVLDRISDPDLGSFFESFNNFSHYGIAVLGTPADERLKYFMDQVEGGSRLQWQLHTHLQETTAHK